MRFGMVSYLNALPFTLPFQLGKVKTETLFSYEVPSRLSHLLDTKELDGALASANVSFRTGFSAMPGFCIGAKERIMSVHLYTRKNIDALSGTTIGVTSDTLASFSLLQILCHHFWKIHPHFVPLSQENPKGHDAFLLIGNKALTQQQIPGFQTIDLAKAWFQYTHLPFVFALFTFRSDVPSHTFQEEIAEAHAWSFNHLDVLIEHACRQTQTPKELVERYYQTCSYLLTPQKQQGLELFKRLLADVPKTDT